MNTDCKILVNGEEINVTQHAIERLLERWPNKSGKPKKPLNVILNMLSSSQLDKNVSPVRRVHRMINNGFVPAEYRVSDGLRFVLVTDDRGKTLVTVERVIRN